MEAASNFGKTLLGLHLVYTSRSYVINSTYHVLSTAFPRTLSLCKIIIIVITIMINNDNDDHNNNKIICIVSWAPEMQRF